MLEYIQSMCISSCNASNSKAFDFSTLYTTTSIPTLNTLNELCPPCCIKKNANVVQMTCFYQGSSWS